MCTPVKKCACGQVHELTCLPKSKTVDGLTYFDCKCGSTLTIKTEFLLDVLLGNAWAIKVYK